MIGTTLYGNNLVFQILTSFMYHIRLSRETMNGFATGNFYLFNNSAGGCSALSDFQIALRWEDS